MGTSNPQGLAPTARSAPHGPLVPEFVPVRGYHEETHDTFTLSLAPVGGQNLSTGGLRGFLPGQFNMLYVFGVGEVPISMSGDAADTGALVHTIRAVGSVTNALAKLRPGDMVGMRGPYGSSWPLEQARGHDVVIVSGGIGLAPLRPAIYHLLRNRNDYGRVVLLHGVRTPEDLLFAEELEAWQRRDDFQVLVAVQQAGESWQGRVGVVTALFPHAVFDPERTIGLMCGPEVMMRFTIREFDQRGVPHDQLYVSLERNMQCAVGFCGHCQFGPSFVCMDGPVFRFDRIEAFFEVREA
jgi:NAD(P)H-flavin reductase